MLCSLTVPLSLPCPPCLRTRLFEETFRACLSHPHFLSPARQPPSRAGEQDLRTQPEGSETLFSAPTHLFWTGSPMREPAEGEAGRTARPAHRLPPSTSQALLPFPACSPDGHSGSCSGRFCCNLALTYLFVAMQDVAAWRPLIEQGIEKMSTSKNFSSEKSSKHLFSSFSTLPSPSPRRSNNSVSCYLSRLFCF